MLLTLQGIGYLKTQEEEYWYYYTTIEMTENRKRTFDDCEGEKR